MQRGLAGYAVFCVLCVLLFFSLLVMTRSAHDMFQGFVRCSVSWSTSLRMCASKLGRSDWPSLFLARWTVTERTLIGENRRRFFLLRFVFYLDILPTSALHSVAVALFLTIKQYIHMPSTLYDMILLRSWEAFLFHESERTYPAKENSKILLEARVCF